MSKYTYRNGYNMEMSVNCKYTKKAREKEILKNLFYYMPKKLY